MRELGLVVRWGKRVSVAAEALGVDYHVAVLRAETILPPQCDVWRDGSDAAANSGPTLD
jgi:hypothetical protein